MKSADKALYEKIKALAGGRVYSFRAPQNVVSPFIIYQEIDSGRWRSINNPSGIAQASFQIDSYATDLYAAKNLALQVEAILDGFLGSVPTDNLSPPTTTKICGISYQNGLDLLEQDAEPLLYRRSDIYLITYEQE